MLEQVNPKIEQVKRELRRRSQDRLIIYNPLTEVFSTTVDGYIHPAPPGEETVFPYRFISEKWMREWVNHMINTDERTAVNKENDRRKSKGWKPMSSEEVNDFVSANGLLTSNETLRIKYYKMIYRGVSSEYGKDVPEPPKKKKQTQRHPDEVLLGKLDAEMGTVLEPASDASVEDKKDALVKEISGEK